MFSLVKLEAGKMRASLFGVIAFSMILSSTTLATEETKDEFKFDQNQIITVEIEPRHPVNETSHYTTYGFMGVGLAVIYAVASYKLSFLQAVNSSIWNLFRFKSARQ